MTGAAGFIGSVLSEELLRRGAARVTGLDLAPADRWHRLDGVPRVRRVTVDVCDVPAVAAALEGCDVVVHLASGTDMARGAVAPADDFRSSLAATTATVEAARLAAVPAFVFASSSAVYGELAARAPARETDGPLLPISTYGAAKLAGEGVVSAYAALFGMRALILRFGTVVGPGMDRGVLPAVVAQLVAGHDPIRLLGSPHLARSFVLVDDVADTVLGLLQAMRDGADVVNVASHGTTTIASVARIAAEAAGRPDAEVVFAGGDRGWRGDVPVVALDVDRLARRYGVARTSDEAVRVAAEALVAEPPRLRPGEPGGRA